MKVPIHINHSSGVPAYIQLMKQIHSLIAVNYFKEDDKLPSVRDLANDLKINPMTISKAYSYLEIEKVVYRLHGKGVFVRAKRSNLSEEECLKQIEGPIRELIYQTINLQIPKAKIISKIKDEYKKIASQGEKK